MAVTNLVLLGEIIILQMCNNSAEVPRPWVSPILRKFNGGQFFLCKSFLFVCVWEEQNILSD
jgi:hypothetical protein